MEKFTMNSVTTQQSDGKKICKVTFDMDGRKFEASYDVDDQKAFKMVEDSVKAFLSGEKKTSAIEVGSKVVIKNTGDVYSSYEDWALKNLKGADLIACGRGFDTDCDRYKGSVGKVVCIAPHGIDNVNIAAVMFGGIMIDRIILIDVNGLELAEENKNESK